MYQNYQRQHETPRLSCHGNKSEVDNGHYLFMDQRRLALFSRYYRPVFKSGNGSNMKAELVSDVLKNGYFHRGRPKDVIVHSDRGSQYCSGDFRNLLQNHELKQSMSRKGNCWDNACAESFFHSLKVEAIHDEPIMDSKTMREAVFEYIEIDIQQNKKP